MQVDKLVTSFALKHSNHRYIADLVMPARPSARTTGVYYKYDRSAISVNAVDVSTASKTGYTEETNFVDMDVSSGSYTLSLRGFAEMIGKDQIMDAGDPVTPIEDAAFNIREKLLLAKEIDFKDLIGATANYATGNKVDLKNSLQWGLYGTATGANGPIRQVHSGTLVIDRKAGGGGRKVMVVTADSHSVVLRNPDVTDSIKYVAMTTKATLSNAMADLFGVDEYMVFKAIQNAAEEGATESLTFVASDFAAILTQPARQTPKSVAYGIQFQRTGMPVGTRRTDPSRKGATIVEVMDEWAFELVDNTAGYIIKDTLA